MPSMRPSRVLAKLRAGEVVNVFKLNLADSRAAEIAAQAGFDCIWTDLEHVANDWSVVERQILAAKTQNADVMVRVARGSYSDYIHPLELDAAGIMVPHLMSLEEARQIVRMTRFHPLGRRPLDGGNADGQYCRVGLDDYLREANEQRFVCVQIEDPEPLAELDAIAALPGIDMLFFGPADFSQGIGDPGNFSNPTLLDARRRVAEAALRHGKFAGTTTNPSTVAETIDLGYQFINLGADVVALLEYCGRTLENYQNVIAARNARAEGK